MKKQSFTQSMAWLHTWGGLLLGWLLFAIFLTGTLAVFDKEIDGWMRPEVPAYTGSQQDALQRALDFLQARHPDAPSWNINLPTERSSNLSVSTGEQRRGGGQLLDAATGEPITARETAGGGFFFRFHFSLNMPRNIGIWLVGLAAMAMLVALVSGIVIHKKIFKDFFTFRPGKGQRSWLDAHNASGVLLLPFHLMITYTGLVIFFLLYMPAAVDALYDGDRQAAVRELRGGAAEQQAERPAEQRGEARQQGGNGERAQGRNRDAGQGQQGRAEAATRPMEAVPAALLAPLGPILAQAEAAMGPVGGLSIQNPGRRDARIEVRPVLGNRIELTKGRSMQFDGVSGVVLREPDESRLSLLTQRVMAGLHFAQFGGYPMRWLYWLCGMVSCAMIATGLVHFCIKRRRKYAEQSPASRRFHRLVESLNLAAVAGLSLACIGLLWANRLLPVQLPQRNDWEVRVFFLVWAAGLVHALWRPTLRGWAEQLALLALLCLALPLLNMATVGGMPWADAPRLWLELTCVAMGAMLLWLARKVALRAGDRLPTPRRAAMKLKEMHP
ncbi:PepSY domain-containing protein [Pseudomonas stutzeri]|uniref:PepSY domain-containing protein n=1 Tax=Stutzerimonas stutzeri TaxID=316 RepID=A0A2N8S2S4_STUST|nr:PepSY-associated TM helix domain-containing protein [Stutzerimonas stutzeri]MCQ4296467.1 PepSY domain-containing protein [Stutzerimonas stutzeri]PNF80902.1 PepSY domain-containing protein [Stutzerimonas stutzeri]